MEVVSASFFISSIVILIQKPTTVEKAMLNAKESSFTAEFLPFLCIYDKEWYTKKNSNLVEGKGEKAIYTKGKQQNFRNIPFKIRVAGYHTQKLLVNTCSM